MVMSSQKVFRLISGDYMPLIGYGTFRVRGRALIYEVLDYALEAGYRLIDTAVVYGNEEDIGEALTTLLPKYNLNREDIFITSKLPPNLYGNFEKILDVVQSSLIKLKVQYLDLYLIHWPGQQGKSPQQEDNSIIRSQTWQALIEAKNRGWVRNIGVSNYTVQHMTELLLNNHGVMPVVNQVEWHPLYYQQELLNLCHDNGILLQAYCSLGGTSDSHVLLNDPNVQRVTKNLYKTPAQVLLAWALQQGVGIIPKSLRKEHIIANFNLDFKIPEQDLKILNHLPQKKFAWDPTIVS
ncbi:uncharacterized protein [Atheta coriaria]|uniref:uncharacterized protein n=1 Tax=Dalotia coriaria TaxID=877792 RepID=UPI0031F431DD